MSKVENLVAEVLTLPAEKRLTLANLILASVEPGTETDADTVWDQEIRRRIANYDADPVRSLNAADVLLELKHRLQK